MKPTKTFKSLAELSSDSIVTVEDESDQAKPSPQHQEFAEGMQRAPIEDFPRVQNVGKFRHWGINE
jgi:hypothetical protein